MKKRSILGIVIQLLLLTCIIADNSINYQRIQKSHEYQYEQNSQANFQMRYPGLVNGIYNFSITQSDFEKAEGQESQTYDEQCNLITDQVVQPTDQLNHITLTELTNSSDTNTKIITLAQYNYNNDQNIYILTDKKEVLQVKIDKQFSLGGKQSFSEIFKDDITITTRLYLATNQVSKKIYAIGHNFIASKELSQNSDFSNTPFVKEEGYKGCYKVEHVLSVQVFIVLSCYLDGLHIYKVDSNGNLVLKRHYKEKENIYQSDYNDQYKLLAFLDSTGIHFIKLVNGEFGDIITEFSINWYEGRSFSQYNFQTFWIKSQDEYQINEIFVDIDNQIQDNNGTQLSNKELIGTYMNDIFGIIFNQNQYSIYIHSIPKSQVSFSRDKIAYFPLEDTEKLLVIEDSKVEDTARIFSVTQKSLKLNVLKFEEPQFICNPREETGKFEYKLRIFSKECDSSTSKELFYQCVIEDTIIMKVNKTYVTSSNQNLAIGLGVGLTVFFISLIFILYICYRKKKLALDLMEEKVSNLKKQKYQQLEQEKISQSNNNNSSSMEP